VLLRRGHAAGVKAAIPFETFAGDVIIDRITEAAGNDAEHRREPPDPAEPGKDRQGGIGTHPEAPGLFEHHGVEISGGEAAFEPNPGGLALERCEAITPMAIAGEKEAHEAVAEIAESIEIDDRPVHLRSGGTASALPSRYRWNQ